MKKPIILQTSHSRRRFLQQTTKSVAALGLGSLILPSWLNASQPKNKLGVALVGLGNYATNQLAPALLATEHCYLAGIVTGSPEKIKPWQEKYNIPDANVYNYENFDQIANNPDIDIVYVVLPNSMHAEYTIRAAHAGKHVICEKPMAVSVAESELMIAACNKNNVKLGIGYRLHYDPFNLEMMRLGQQQVFGKVNQLKADFQFKMDDLTQWRAKRELAGGGPLMDLGVYCIQGCLYTLGELPTSITAKDTTETKADWPTVEGSLTWEMGFESGAVAHCSSSYERDYFGQLKASASEGDFGLSPAYIYGNLKGTTPKGGMGFTPVNQQAKQMDGFASDVLMNRPSLVPGEMGMRDMMIIEAIYQSMNNNGKHVSLKGLPKVLHKV